MLLFNKLITYNCIWFLIVGVPLDVITGLRSQFAGSVEPDLVKASEGNKQICKN